MTDKVFLDTRVLFSAVHSETGGARLILQLGEARAIQLWVGPQVLQEANGVLERKSPASKAYFALLLDRSRVRMGPEAGEAALETALEVIAYHPDAQVVAEALEVGADYLVSFDREHLLGNPQAGRLPFPLGTAGDFLAWYRAKLSGADNPLLR
ncbi:MAG: putative toxin-antitoxin system toxin component, PIN family [Anaerolineales bacterium]